MQITVFQCVHKEIDNTFSPGANYSFHESGLQITLRLLSSSLGNIALFSIKLQFTCKTSDKSEKNRKTA